MVTQQRAYSNEQKNQRREGIMSAAATLFKNRRYEEVTMLEIAKQAGVAKGTLYVYFHTKEELFLAYAQQEIDLFFNRLHQNLMTFREPIGVKGFVAALGNAFAERKEMVRLLALLHVVLESNTRFESALEFRRLLIPLLEQTGTEVERHLWFVEAGMGKRLLLTIHGMSLGFQQLSDPSLVIRQVEKEPGMEIYKFDFGTALLGSVDLMLAGMEVRANGAKL